MNRIKIFNNIFYRLNKLTGLSIYLKIIHAHIILWREEYFIFNVIYILI